MVKSFLTLSMVASIALFTVGCGSSNSNSGPTTVADTSGPVFTNNTTLFHVVEGASKTIELNATDTSEPVLFSIPATPNFALNGKTLTFSAPTYEDNASNEYNITVEAKDSLNNGSSKTFSFIVDPKKASSEIVATGDKNLTVSGDSITGPAGLEWLNDNAPIMTYEDAVQYCQDAGYRVARRDEILNLMNYETPHDTATGKRTLEDEFVNSASTSWAAKVDNTFFSVNLNSGADGIEADGSATYSVLCTKGRSADPHSFKVSDGNSSLIVDQETKLTWTTVAVDDDSQRRAIDPDPADAPAVSQQPAADYCPVGFRLPSINELRSVVDYSSNSVNTDIIPSSADTAKKVIVWSSTEDQTHTSAIAKNFHIEATNKGIISTDPQSTAYFVTCVKRASE